MCGWICSFSSAPFQISPSEAATTGLSLFRNKSLMLGGTLQKFAIFLKLWKFPSCSYSRNMKKFEGFRMVISSSKNLFFYRIQLCIWYATIADRSVSALASYSASNSEKKIILNFMKLIYALSEKSRYIRNKHARCSLVLK